MIGFESGSVNQEGNMVDEGEVKLKMRRGFLNVICLQDKQYKPGQVLFYFLNEFP